MRLTGVTTIWSGSTSAVSSASASFISVSLFIKGLRSLPKLLRRAGGGFGSPLLVLPSTSSAEKTCSLTSISSSGWKSSQLRSSRGLYPSLAWLAAAAAAAFVYRGLGVTCEGRRRSLLSRLGRVCIADLLNGGVLVTLSTGFPLFSMCTLGGLARDLDGFGISELGISLPSASTQRPPPPGPPAMYLRFFGGGPAGVRAEGRGDAESAAMLFALRTAGSYDFSVW